MRQKKLYMEMLSNFKGAENVFILITKFQLTRKEDTTFSLFRNGTFSNF